MDVGIDLGTATVIVYIGGQGVVLSEPSVIAVNLKTDSVISVGQEAYDMVGKTPSHIQAIRPLSKGVVCDYKMTEEMVKFFIKKVCRDSLVKPRIALCVPSGITNVESNAVIDVAIASGARKVYLIEEPVAAAIGANIDTAIFIVDRKERLVEAVFENTQDILGIPARDFFVPNELSPNEAYANVAAIVHSGAGDKARTWEFEADNPALGRSQWLRMTGGP